MTAAADDLLHRLEELNAIGISLSRERNIHRLLESILLAAKTITHADAGTLYRVVDGRYLAFEILRTDSLNIAMGGTSGVPVSFETIPLFDAAGNPNDSMVVAYAVLHDRTVNIADAYTEAGFDFSGTRNFDRKTGYRSRSFLTVPMKNHENEIIGVMQLINAISPATGEIVAFSDADQRLAESLASQAAIALTNRILINQLEELFESFIKLINTAIDEKSPYTSAHCQRVPVLTMMLAEAASATQQGPLASFQLSERDYYELKIAGLLHDCGKITTPVHVVDKATKLQTIFDRIQLVDARFEVLKRDAEISLLQSRLAVLEGKSAAVDAERRFAERTRQLEDDREFLHRCNTGGEFMAAADQERVRKIAAYSWLGPKGEETPLLSGDEAYNLTIEKGTLNPEEREIIKRHVVMTINMLEALPWPRHLRNVPEYAGGHHECVDGMGYPKGLTREQMSVQARIIAIADIFEALTASDRPYKPAKTLPETLAILGKMKLDNHIDGDLFDIFIREKIYLRYAEMFLDAKQINEVDVSRIPGYSG